MTFELVNSWSASIVHGSVGMHGTDSRRYCNGLGHPTEIQECAEETHAKALNMHMLDYFHSTQYDSVWVAGGTLYPYTGSGLISGACGLRIDLC